MESKRNNQKKKKLFDLDNPELLPGELKKKAIRKVTDVSKNPFVKEWHFPVSFRVNMCYLGNDTTPTPLNKLTKDDMSQIETNDFRPVMLDSPHIRFFLSDNEKLREKLYKMEGKALNLLFYIMFNLKHHHFIDLKISTVCKKLGIKSKQTFYTHISVLEKSNFIRKGQEGRYYVNIQLLSDGVRSYNFPEFCYSPEGTYKELKEKVKKEARAKLSKKGN